MTLDELRTTVEGGLARDGSYELSAADLSSPRVTALAVRFFPGGALRLSEAAVGDGGGETTVVIQGTGVETPFTGARVEATFSLVGDVAAVQLTAWPQGVWTLGSAFPALAGTIAADLRFGTSPPLRLDLASEPGNGGETGMAFAGALDLQATSAELATLLNRSAQPLSGVIDAAKNGATVTRLELTSPAATGVNLGLMTLDELDFRVSGAFSYDPVSGAVGVAPRLGLSGLFGFEAQGIHRDLPISADVWDLGRRWEFRVGLDGAANAAWDELESLVGGVQIGSLLPEGFHLDSVLLFDDLVFDLDLAAPASGKVATVALGVRNASPWSLMRLGGSDQNLVLTELHLTAVVQEPMGQRNAVVSLKGELALGAAGVLEVSARYPGLALGAWLKEGTTLHIDELVAYFAGSGVELPSVEVRELNLQITGATYTVDVEADGDWPIGALPLSVNQLAFGIEHTGGGTAVTASAVLAIAGVELYLHAAHGGAAGLGWRFEGGTMPEQTIPIGRLIADLVRVFAVDATVPDVVSTATISELRVAFDTGTRAFTFFCDTRLTLGSGTTPGADGKALDATLAIDVKPSGSGYEKTVRGTVKVGELEFDLTFDADPATTRFLAGYEDASGGTVNLGTLLGAVTDDPAVTEAAGAFSLSLKDALFIYDRSGTDPSRVVFGADIGAGIDLSNLPLVGRAFPAGDALTLAFQPVVATNDVPQPEADALRALVPPGGLALPDGAIAKGLTLATRLQLGGTPVQLALPFGIEQGTGAIAPTAATAPGGTTTPGSTAPAAASAPDGVHWVALQRAFGPVQLQRVGVRFQNGDLGFLLDGALSAAGLTLALDGLEADVTLADIQAHRFAPTFRLRGVGVAYDNGAVTVAGALLHLTPEETGGADEYDGLATLRASGIGLAAIGSYAELDGFRSLFLYAALSAPLGGPPFFFVTGLAAGFGFNRALRVPAMDALLDFPLVATAMQAAGADPPPVAVGAAGRSYLLDKLTTLHDYVPVQQGRYFLAVGLRVSTFEVLDTFALLTVSVGARGAEFDLLGVMSLVLPPGVEDEGVTPLAELQLALRAAVVPDEGWAGLFGELTRNSYVLSRSARLTGGFAICSWFDGPHAGDFVVTVGGYHPGFRVPSHYPSVPRLGLNWQISTALTVKGGLYFALVPHAAMAGGDLEVLFAEGSIRAWFRAGAHFLVAWKPFHYEAEVYVDMGVSYTFSLFGTHTISVDLGADLKLWGPDFSGEARVHLYIVSFTIAFGAGAAPPPSLDWAAFRGSFLPPDQNGRQVVLGVSAQAGLIRRAKDDAGELDVVNPKELVLATNSLIPATTDGHGAAFPAIGIGPMAVPMGAVTSTHAVAVHFRGAPADDLFVLQPVPKRAPRALWGGALRPDLNGEAAIEGAVAGFEVRPAKPPTPGQTHAVPRANLRYDTELSPLLVATASDRAFTPAADQGRTRLEARIADDATAAARAGMLRALGYDPVAAVTGLGPAVADDFLFPPRIGALARAA